jgi:hypothetical protein
MDEPTPRQALPGASNPPPERRLRLSSLPWLYGPLSILVIAGIIGTALALVRSHVPPDTSALARSQPSPPLGSDFWVGGTPVTREVQAGGLHFVMQVTPGPYFLGELLAADLVLRNDSHTTYTLTGQSSFSPWVDGICGATLFVTMSGGATVLQYGLPLGEGVPTCPFGDFPLAPGQTLTIHKFMPLTSTGELTLQAGASFVTQTVTMPLHTPLDGRWPSLKIAVAAATPSDRQITLQRKAAQVQINAPRAARAHLFYIDAVTCGASHGGTALSGSMVWKPLATAVVQESNCGESSGPTIQWWYMVSAPGYAITSGHADP